MKKQYWYSREHNFKRDVILFEDNQPITIYSGFEADEFIAQAESEGYVRGYPKEDVEEAWNHYVKLKQNEIKVDYNKIGELLK